MKDGVYWGLGHSSTILLIGMVVILGRHSVSEDVFSKMEVLVGLMLIVLGAWRIWSVTGAKEKDGVVDDKPSYGLAYGVGLVHGLAGSGALIVLVLAAQTEVAPALLYLLLFGLGSVGGMLVAAGLLGLPFSRALLGRGHLQTSLVILSGLSCAIYGGYVMATHAAA